MAEYQVSCITCQDGYQLAARFYPASSPQKKQRPVLLAPATGITMRFYHSFASWLCTEGYDVLTFDFRGIGASLKGSVKHSNASIVSWGQQDLPAAIDALLSLTGQEQLLLLGHSAGGQLLGLAANHHKVAKVVAVAGSSGYVKGQKGSHLLLAPFLFHIVFPLGRFFLGYGPSKLMGMGENLPKEVARQWSDYCSKPGYILNAVGKDMNVEDDFHAQIRCDITSIWANDDNIATSVTVNDFLRLYPNATTTQRELTPSHYQQKNIGHMLMFKKSHKTVWPVVLKELEVASD